MPITLGAVAPYAMTLLGGLFGGRQKMTPEQMLQRNISRQLYGFSQNQPFSDPQERLALGQDLGMLGEFAANQRQNLMAQMPALGGMSNAPDMLANLNSLQTAQRMNLQSQHMMNALAQRRQAMLQAAGVAGGVGQPQGGGSQLPAMMGQLAQAYAYSQAFKPQKQPGGGGLPAAHADQLRQIMAGAGGEMMPTGGIGGTAPGMPGFNTQALAQAAGAMSAPGNEPFGMNGEMNQVRQASGMGRAMMNRPEDMHGDLMAGLYNPLERRKITPNGLNFGY